MLEESFPGLKSTKYRIASPVNFNNNCLGWALGDTNRWWEKGRGCYWPDEDIPDDAVEGWITVFEFSGYRKTDTSELEPGFEKVAICAKAGEPTHAARQMSSGRWTSKLGWGHDIEHDTLKSLEGLAYGTVAEILKRERKDRET